MNKCEPVEAQSPFYYSLLGAVNHFGLTTNEIIDLAITGDVILSIKISKEYTPYLMSAVEPEESKKFGFLLYTRKTLKDKSMLPQEVDAEYINLGVDDCKVLKTSILRQSVFQSAFRELHYSHLKHVLIHSKNDWVYDVKLDLDKSRLDELQEDDSLCEQAVVVNNLPPNNRERFINGVHAVQSGEYSRRFVLIDAYLEVESADGIEFLAGSELNQTFSEGLIITHNEIEISSNYERVLEQFQTVSTIPELVKPAESAEITVDDIPTTSCYYLPKKCRYSSKLNLLAVLGYRLYENESLAIPSNLTTYIEKMLSVNEKEAETAAFFINPNPAGKMAVNFKGKTQFDHLCKIYEQFYSLGKLKSNINKKQVKQLINNKFDAEYGYSAEKCRYAVRFVVPDMKNYGCC